MGYIQMMNMDPARSWSVRPSFGYLLAAAATLIWSGNFIIARGLADTIPPVLLAFLRWSVAALVVLPIGAPSLWRQRRVLRQHLGYLLLTSFCGVTLFNTLIYTAGETTSALNMSLLAIGTSIFIIVLARIVLGERLSAAKIAGVILATFGVLLLVTRGDLFRLQGLVFAEGDLWMIMAALVWAVYTILVHKKPSEINQRTFLIASFWLGLALLAPWAAWVYLDTAELKMGPAIMGVALYLGVGTSVVAYLLWNRAVSIVGASNVALIYYTLPLFSGFEAFLILSEPATIVHLFSGALIIGGVILATLLPIDQSSL